MKTSLGDFVRLPQCYVSESLAFKPQAPALIDAERFAILPKLVKRLKLFFFSVMNTDCTTAKRCCSAAGLLQRGDSQK